MALWLTLTRHLAEGRHGALGRRRRAYRRRSAAEVGQAADTGAKSRARLLLGGAPARLRKPPPWRPFRKQRSREEGFG